MPLFGKRDRERAYRRKQQEEGQAKSPPILRVLHEGRPFAALRVDRKEAPSKSEPSTRNERIRYARSSEARSTKKTLKTTNRKRRSARQRSKDDFCCTPTRISAVA